MSFVLNDFSVTALVQANEANQETAFKLLAGLPDVDILETPELLRLYTGVPHYAVNGVLRTRLPDSSANSQIEEAIGYFQSRRTPMMWAVGPSTLPTDLGVRLLSHGLTYLDDMPGMAIDLERLPQSMPIPNTATVGEVKNDGALQDWADVGTAGFRLPGEVMSLFAAAARAGGYGEQASVRNFLAYDDNQPVAASTLCLGAGVAGIYNVCVVPEARRKGIGAAITVAPLRAARRLGYRIGTLLASAMGYPIYRRLGFEEHGRFRLYGWTVPADDGYAVPHRYPIP